jgi:serine/threonine-protein phosphatase 2A regulatory subunit B''
VCRFFYEEQLHRMESASQAPVTFNDILCQMQDMLSPAAPGHFTLRDLRKTRQLAGTLFNILFNLGKFVAYETRDPFLMRQEKADDPDATEWDRFARQEYIRLALEEETADDSQMDGDGSWEPQEAAALLDMGGGAGRDGLDGAGVAAGGAPLVTPSFLS